MMAKGANFWGASQIRKNDEGEKRPLFASKLDLNLRKKLVKYYIRSMALYGAETGTLREVVQKTWKFLKCGTGEGWRRSVGPIL
jgi:hypothetical protein